MIASLSSRENSCSSVSTVAVRGVESADHFDGRLQMDRIHQVDAHDIGRTLGGAADLRDGNTRGIGPKTDFGRHHSLQILIDLLLDLPVLGDVLDDEVARRNVPQIGRQDHALDGLILRDPWQRFRQQRDDSYVVQYFGLGALQYLFRNIDHHRGYPMKNQVGYNANADIACAKNAYSSEFHLTKLFASSCYIVSADPVARPPQLWFRRGSLQSARTQFGGEKCHGRALEQTDDRQGLFQLFLDHGNHLDGPE